ncbi:response regulator transcription factor [Rapidithrix thailandica]|uniref:Response regulator transcription factor n=1 Tax=Rapidithrix thailandica TaxID=413964 RepID=A0AAW9SEC4_9BACT
MKMNLQQDPVNIVIIEDTKEVREGFALILNTIPSFHIVSTYPNCEDALKRLHKDAPDILLLDIELPGMSGIDGIRKIRKMNPEISIIIISVHTEHQMVFNALSAGATGYLTKNVSAVELVEAIRKIMEGGAPMSAVIAKMVVQSFQRNPHSPLSKRETEVLTEVSQGNTYELIAEKLFISKETVKTHIKHIYDKLQVRNRSEAIQKALSEKLI